MKRLIPVIAVLVSLTSCSQAPAPGSAPEEKTLSLAEGQSASIANGGRVTFANVVNESRCAKGVTCVWAGTATARFQLIPSAGSSEVDVLAVLPGGVSKDDIANLLPVDTLGVRLTLVELLPYPEAGKEPGKRRAVLKVLPTK